MSGSPDISNLLEFLAASLEMFESARAAGRSIEIDRELVEIFAHSAREAFDCACRLDNRMKNLLDMEEIARDLDLIEHAKAGELKPCADVYDLSEAFSRERSSFAADASTIFESDNVIAFPTHIQGGAL